MKKIYSNLSELIGNTPLLMLRNYCLERDVPARIIAKLEYFNPLSSVKDRVAWAMIQDAEEKGLLEPDSVIIEPTSGNTGIGLAFIGAIKGYSVILTMPETMSKERISLLKALGAQIELTPGSSGMNGAVLRANELKNSIPDSIILNQFKNRANPIIHEKTTAVEILRDTQGDIDVFVVGVGTSGTLVGVGKVLKAYNPDIYVIAVEPASSPVISKGEKGAHKVQGIGPGFIPDIYDPKVADEIVTVEDEDALLACKEVARLEGLLVGISSGAALCAAEKIANRAEYKNKKILTVFPDGGERYLSCGIYD